MEPGAQYSPHEHLSSCNDSIRQWMALPEVLIVLYMIPKLYRGFRRIMRYHRFEFLAVLFVAAAITFAYSSVTTNAGPLMRWRLQVANVYIIMAAIGMSKQYSLPNVYKHTHMA